MLYTLISSQLFVEKRSRFFSTISERAQKVWNEWELRLAVLLSLFFQILLILLGDRRRHIKGIWVQIILWISYLCADWVAAVALGILSHSIEQPKANQLPPFWAPFLLLHLGGPDTITAFSLEDNELWLRHLLGLGVQGSIASYVSYRSWTGTTISILSVLMYVPAIVKYGERTWVLSSASKEHLRNSMLGPPDPGPSYAKFLDEYVSKEEEGFQVKVETIQENPQTQALDQFRLATNTTAAGDKKDSRSTEEEEEEEEEEEDAIATTVIIDAHYFFEIFKRLFAFLILTYDDWVESKSYFQQISYQKAYKLIEIELGFMFDVLYTKASLVYSMKGCILRSISLSFTISVFVMFLLINVVYKHRHPPIDHSTSTEDIIEVTITLLLLSLAIILEIYAAIILISSDSAFLWLRKHRLDRLANLLLKCHGCCRRKRTRWSNYVAQYNLLSVWLKDKPTKFILVTKLGKLLGIDKKIRKYWYTNYKHVPERLKELIFQQLRRKSEKATDFDKAKRLCTSRSDQLQELPCWSTIEWSIVKAEFDQSILIWHIATDLCYHSDGIPQQEITCKEKGEMCKLLSDYMVYLLVVCPFMLPEGIGEIRSLDTEEEAMIFFKDQENQVLDTTEACKLLLAVKTDIPPIEVKGPKSKSVLFDACRLADQLKSLEINEKWETVSLVWVEMLSYAAAQCKGPCHAQQLGQGGELLTHVWLLMAHLGITEQFQMPTGFAKKLMYQ